MSARNPQRVSSPCSLLDSLASTQRYSLSRSHTHLAALLTLSLTHTPRSLSPMHKQTRYHSLPILLTFLSSLTQHLFPMGVIRFPRSLCFWMTDQIIDWPESLVHYEARQAPSTCFSCLSAPKNLDKTICNVVCPATARMWLHENKWRYFVAMCAKPKRFI